MVVQLFVIVCTMGLIVMAILIMTKAISLEDALKETGKTLLILVILCFAVCYLGPALHATIAALAGLLMAAIRWLVVAVFAAALLMLLPRLLRWRFSGRSNRKSSRHGGDI
jgi:hypothetical protein